MSPVARESRSKAEAGLNRRAATSHSTYAAPYAALDRIVALKLYKLERILACVSVTHTTRDTHTWQMGSSLSHSLSLTSRRDREFSRAAHLSIKKLGCVKKKPAPAAAQSHTPDTHTATAHSRPCPCCAHTTHTAQHTGHTAHTARVHTASVSPLSRNCLVLRARVCNQVCPSGSSFHFPVPSPAHLTPLRSLSAALPSPSRREECDCTGDCSMQRSIKSQSRTIVTCSGHGSSFPSRLPSHLLSQLLSCGQSPAASWQPPSSWVGLLPEP